MGEPIRISSVLPDTVYDHFKKQPLWVADKSVELYGIRLDVGDIALTIQWYEHIPGVSGSDLVYRLYCDSPTQVQIHTQLVHVNISMNQISGAVERHTYPRNKSTSPPESLQGNHLQWK